MLPSSWSRTLAESCATLQVYIILLPADVQGPRQCRTSLRLYATVSWSPCLSVALHRMSRRNNGSSSRASLWVLPIAYSSNTRNRGLITISSAKRGIRDILGIVSRSSSVITSRFGFLHVDVSKCCTVRNARRHVFVRFARPWSHS